MAQYVKQHCPRMRLQSLSSRYFIIFSYKMTRYLENLLVVMWMCVNERRAVPWKMLYVNFYSISVDVWRSKFDEDQQSRDSVSGSKHFEWCVEFKFRYTWDNDEICIQHSKLILLNINIFLTASIFLVFLLFIVAFVYWEPDLCLDASKVEITPKLNANKKLDLTVDTSPEAQLPSGTRQHLTYHSN